MTFYSDFAQYYEAIFPFSKAVHAFLQSYLPPMPACVLDIGCGTGHYCGKLSIDGFEAVGIDLDTAMIDYAEQHYPHATFHCMNMLDVSDLLRTASVSNYPITPSPRCFDAAYCIGNTAAHLTQAQFAQFLHSARQILKHGASWIVQVMNWDYVLNQDHIQFPMVEAESGIHFYREYRDISEQQVTFHTRLETARGIVFEDSVPLYPLRAAQVIALHQQAGFEYREHFGSYSSASFDADVFSASIFVMAAQ